MVKFLLHAYGEFGPGQALRRTLWPHFDLLFVHEGRLVLRPDKGEPVELVAGEGILLFPDTAVASGDPRSSARASVQHFAWLGEPALPGAFGRLAVKRAGFLLRRGPRDVELEGDIERAIRMAEHEATPESQMMRESLLMLILGKFIEGEGAKAGVSGDLEGLLEWLRGRELEGVDSGVLAKRLGVSAGTLRRKFREHLGISPAQYLLRLRMNEAKRLLSETLSPIKEIAARCGYGSAIAFHRAFRESVGLTPRSFRLRHRVGG